MTLVCVNAVLLKGVCHPKIHIQPVMSLCFQLSMEAGEEKSGNINLKRQRAPLSDSEDNVFLPSGLFVPVY